MKERPILFSGPMVRAILNGSKAMTRRVVKPQPVSGISVDPIKREWAEGIPRCPYGQPGARLWVRETWRETGSAMMADNSIPKWGRFDQVRYAADDIKDGPFRPSIHMPRWASRITLEVVSVKVERVHDIGMVDAAAEGCPLLDTTEFETPVCWFHSLWDSINAKRGYGWDVNPWVWVIQFKRIQS